MVHAKDNPPSYDYATGSDGGGVRKTQPDKRSTDDDADALIGKHPGPVPVPIAPPQLRAGPSYDPRGATMHHYVNPETGERIMTVLPPDHPEMICLQEGRHIRSVKVGLLGLLAAVFFFPIGIGLCLLDRRVKCERCGRVLEDGISC